MNREWLARAPLPLLALSAAWGVWQFQMQFTPWFVALLSALAFESVYLSLALVPVVDSRRATVISITAVVVSVVYNTLSSLFHLRPALLDNRTLVMDGVLALLHGAPLAIVAYAVADLLLHRRQDAPIATPYVASLQAELAQALKENITWREECANQEQLIGAMLTEIDTKVRELPPRQLSAKPADNEVVNLKDVQGLSFAKIGTQLGISRQAAFQRYKDAKKAVNHVPA